MQAKFSALIGIVGGIIDLLAGLALLLPALSMQSMGLRPMVSPYTLWAGYFLLALGIVVLLTGVYMLTVRMMPHRSTFGWVMIIYGVIMLILGVAMIGQMFSMMQGSTLSGGVMIIVGVAMLYSGSNMARK